MKFNIYEHNSTEQHNINIPVALKLPLIPSIFYWCECGAIPTTRVELQQHHSFPLLNAKLLSKLLHDESGGISTKQVKLEWTG